MSEKTVVLQVPPWGVLETVLAQTGISRNWLNELVAKNLVRKRSRSEHRQARTVYCITDVLEVLSGGAVD